MVYRVDSKLLVVGVCDEETVGNVLVIDSMFVGSGATPHTPPPEEEPSPDPWNQMHSSVN
ncbi:MAG: hypothetical protein PVF83_18805 [Anaerolineales bacterium]